MRVNGLMCAVWLTILWVIMVGESVFAQGTLHRQAPASADKDSSGNLKKQDDSSVKANQRVHGVVVSPDGAMPEEPGGDQCRLPGS